MRQEPERYEMAGHQIVRSSWSYEITGGPVLPPGKYERLHAGALELTRVIAGEYPGGVKVKNLKQDTVERVLRSFGIDDGLVPPVAGSLEQPIAWDAIPGALLAAADFAELAGRLERDVEKITNEVSRAYDAAQNALTKLAQHKQVPGAQAAKVIANALGPFVEAVNALSDAATLDDSPQQRFERYAYAGKAYMSAAGERGTSVHAMLERACREISATREWRVDWESMLLEGTNDADVALAKRGIELLGRWLKYNPNAIVGVELLAVQPHIGIAGSPDLIVRSPEDGSLTVVDWKTQRSPDPTGWWAQLALYATAPYIADLDDVWMTEITTTPGRRVPLADAEGYEQLYLALYSRTWKLEVEINGEYVPLADQGVIIHVPFDGPAHRYRTASYADTRFAQALSAIATYVMASRNRNSLALFDADTITETPEADTIPIVEATPTTPEESGEPELEPEMGPEPELELGADPGTTVASTATAPTLEEPVPDAVAVTSEMPTTVRNRLRAIAKSTNCNYEVAVRELVLQYGSVSRVVNALQTDPRSIQQMLASIGKQTSRKSAGMQVS